MYLPTDYQTMTLDSDTDVDLDLAQPTYLLECLNVCALNMAWIIKAAESAEAGGVAVHAIAMHLTAAPPTTRWQLVLVSSSPSLLFGLCVCHMAYDGFMFKLRASNLMDFVIFWKTKEEHSSFCVRVHIS